MFRLNSCIIYCLEILHITRLTKKKKKLVENVYTICYTNSLYALKLLLEKTLYKLFK